MIVLTKWWGVMLYATDDEEVELLKQLATQTGDKADEAYEEGDIELTLSGTKAWDDFVARYRYDIARGSLESALGCLVFHR